MSKIIFKTPWFELQEIINPKEPKEIFYGLNALDYVTCVPFDKEGKVILISQFRPVLNKFCLETPGGQVDNGQSPLEAISNELIEETGYEFESIIKINTLDPDVGRLMNKLHIFKAVNIKNIVSKPEKGIEVKKYHVREIKELIKKNIFTTAYSILALSLAINEI